MSAPRKAVKKPATKKTAATSAKRPAAKKPAGQAAAKATAKKAIAKPAAKKPVAKKPVAKKPVASATPKKMGPRADFGSPIDGFFAKQPPVLREVLETLRKIIDEVTPDAESSIKWGMPFYTLQGAMYCALGGHKSHVNLILSGPEETFDDPEGRLTGTGKTGRHLKITNLGELPQKAVRGWLRAAAERARKGG